MVIEKIAGLLRIEQSENLVFVFTDEGLDIYYKKDGMWCIHSKETFEEMKEADDV